MKKLIITSLLTFFLIFNANSGTDGVNEISKNKPKDVKASSHTVKCASDVIPYFVTVFYSTLFCLRLCLCLCISVKWWR